MRVDLFVSPGCPGCPAARTVVESFARARPDVEVREWDLSRDPGPASGRGIFATPTLLLDGIHILPGVPSLTDLMRHAGEPGDARAPDMPAGRSQAS